MWKPLYLEKKLHVRIVVDYAETQFSNFAIEYLLKKVCKTVFACSFGAQVKSFKPKFFFEILWHYPFNL